MTTSPLVRFSRFGIVALALCFAGAASAQLAFNGAPPQAEVGVAYGPQQLVSGGTAPYTCAPPGLHNGLTLNGDCTVSGTPISAGPTTFTAVIATDSTLPVPETAGPQDVTIQVFAALGITTTSPLPGGTQGVAYSAPMSATGGTGSYSWSLVSVNPAASISVNPSGSVDWGTPLAGTYGITVQVGD